jgi:hypothetical protein
MPSTLVRRTPFAGKLRHRRRSIHRRRLAVGHRADASRVPSIRTSSANGQPIPQPFKVRNRVSHAAPAVRGSLISAHLPAEKSFRLA